MTPLIMITYAYDLKSYLQRSFPELYDDHEFINGRAESANKEYETHIINGDPPFIATEYAREVLFEGLIYSLSDHIREVLYFGYDEKYEEDSKEAEAEILKIRSEIEKRIKTIEEVEEIEIDMGTSNPIIEDIIDDHLLERGYRKKYDEQELRELVLLCDELFNPINLTQKTLSKLISELKDVFCSYRGDELMVRIFKYMDSFYFKHEIKCERDEYLIDNFTYKHKFTKYTNSTN